MKYPLHTLALAAALTALAGCATPPPNPAATEINLVAINDLHGNLEATKFTYTGSADTKPRTVMAGVTDPSTGTGGRRRGENVGFGTAVIVEKGSRLAVVIRTVR